MVEALVGRLQRDLVRARVQGLRDAIRETLVGTWDDVLNVQLQPAVGTLDLDVRSR